MVSEVVIRISNADVEDNPSVEFQKIFSTSQCHSFNLNYDMQKYIIYFIIRWVIKFF